MFRYSAFASCVLVATTQFAQSATLTGTFDGTFSAPAAATSPIAQQGGGTETLSWGASNSTATTVTQGDSSTLSLNGTSFSYQAITPGQFFLGSIIWENQSNWRTGRTWNSVLSLSLDIDAAAGPIRRSADVAFSLENTTDVSFDTNVNETNGRNPDVIRGFAINSAAYGAPVKLGNGYQLTGVSFRLDDAGTFGSAAGGFDGLGFLVDGAPAGSSYFADSGLWLNREGGVSEIGVYAEVSAVPLPAGVWLLISGLAGAFVTLRRRARAA